MRGLSAWCWGLIASGLLLGASAPAEAQATLFVTVRTFDDLGDQVPVPDATIRVTHDKTRVRASGLVASSTTDISGVAAMAVSSGWYIVTASADGYEPQSVETKVGAGDVAVGFLLQPAPPDPIPSDPIPEAKARIVSRGVVSGRVMTLEGEPVTNAIVELTAPGQPRTTVLPASDGSFRARVAPSDTYTMKVRPIGVRPPGPMPPVTYILDIVEYSLTVPVAANHETAGVEIRLPAHPEFRLKVTLNDGTGRVPLGARVEAYQPRTPVRYANPDGTLTVVSGPGESVGYVDLNGTVSLGPLLPGPVTIFAIADGPTSRLAATARVEIQNQALDDVFLELFPGARISGRVEFEGLERPLHGQAPLKVLARVPGDYGYKPNDPNGAVEADGSFVVDGLVGDRCLALVGIPGGWRLAGVTHEGRDVTSVPMNSELGQEVSGVVFSVVSGSERSSPRRSCHPQ